MKDLYQKKYITKDYNEMDILSLQNEQNSQSPMGEEAQTAPLYCLRRVIWG